MHEIFIHDPNQYHYKPLESLLDPEMKHIGLVLGR